jgi:hypothetical protein
MSSRLVLFPPPSVPPPPDPGSAVPPGVTAVATRPPVDTAGAALEPLPAFDGNPLESFDAEADAVGNLPAPVRRARSPWPVAGLGLGGVLALAAVVGFGLMRRETPAPGGAGQARFESMPTGLEVLIDGTVRGRTPLTLSLPVGEHRLEVRGASGGRTMPITVEAGVMLSQYVELSPAPGGAVGRLDISSAPSGAQVLVDGVARGTTPLVLEGLDTGQHAVSLTRGGATVNRTVDVSAGATASVFASLGASAPGAAPAPVSGSVGGFLSLRAPIELQVFESGRLLGTTSADRLMLPTGTHQLELANAALGFRTAVTVNVEAGKESAVAIPLPNGSVSINAAPWAEVTIDGQPVGTTPLANVAVPIGGHEIVWRHPQLGERRQTITVTPQAPVRVGVSFAP